jgi:hypothetical protein
MCFSTVNFFRSASNIEYIRQFIIQNRERKPQCRRRGGVEDEIVTCSVINYVNENIYNT